MALMDEFKEERAAMKQQPFKKRWKYFWDYHKWHVIIATFVVLCVGNFIYSVVTAKETALMVGFIDCYSNDDAKEAYKNELIELMGIDTKTHDIVLDNSYLLSGMDTMEASFAEILGVRIMAGELDVFLSPEDIFNRYVQNDIFYDLRDVLSPEQLEYYQDSFYYVDRAVLEKEEIYETDYAETQFVDNTDHTTPEGMDDPIVAGIYVTGTEEFQHIYYFQRDTQEVVFGIPGYVEDCTYALQFLDNMSGRVE